MEQKHSHHYFKPFLMYWKHKRDVSLSAIQKHSFHLFSSTLFASLSFFLRIVSFFWWMSIAKVNGWEERTIISVTNDHNHNHNELETIFEHHYKWETLPFGKTNLPINRELHVFAPDRHAENLNGCWKNPKAFFFNLFSSVCSFLHRYR